MTKMITIAAILLLIGVVNADTNVAIAVESAENINVESTFVGEKIISNQNFNANEVEVYFNGISLRNYTPDRIVDVETNTDAALSAFTRALKTMAQYRNGERSSVSHTEGKMLKYFLEITQAEMQDFHDEVTVKELQALQEWLQINTNQITINLGEIAKNRQAIVQNHDEAVNALNTLGYQVQAQDLALKRVNKDAYCNALVEVMNENGFKRVKCDVNSRYCYNGKEMNFEGGRDWCIDIDEQEMKPQCYLEGTCGKIGDITASVGTSGEILLVASNFHNNHESEDRNVVGKVEIFEPSGAIVKTCNIDLGVVKPGETKSISGDCHIDLSNGEYDSRISIGSSGFEVLDNAKLKVNKIQKKEEPVVVETIESQQLEKEENIPVMGMAVAPLKPTGNSPVPMMLLSALCGMLGAVLLGKIQAVVKQKNVGANSYAQSDACLTEAKKQ